MKRSRKTKRNQSLRPGSINPLQEVRQKIQGVPFYLGQAASGTGCIYSEESNNTYTAAGKVDLDPAAIGGRFVLMASWFTQYKVNKAFIRYVPFQGSNGLLNSPSGTGTSSSSRTVSLAQVPDPAASNGNFAADVNCGAVVFNTHERATLKLRDARLGNWLYTSNTVSSPPSLDERSTCFSTLSAHFYDTSTTAVVKYGVLIVDFDVTFRGLQFDEAVQARISPALSGASVVNISDSHVVKDVPDEKKTTMPDGRPAASAANAQATKGWF